MNRQGEDRLNDLDLLTAQELADELKVSIRTVREWSVNGNGPRRVKIGRHVRYPRVDLRAWLESRYVD